MKPGLDVPTFKQITAPPLAARLISELLDNFRAIASGPAEYTKVAFFPESSADWLPARFLKQIGDAIGGLVSHPLRYIKGALTPDDIGMKRRRSMTIALAMSWVVHGALIVYLIYAALVAPYVGIKIVDAKYEQLDTAVYLKPLYYPPQLLPQVTGEPESIDKLKKDEAARKRREELLRRQREEKEKEELAKKEEEARKKAEQEAAAKEAAKKPASNTFGEINIAPIKDIVGNLYQMYEAGQLNMGSNLTLMCSFTIVPDGSIPKETIKIIKPSGNKVLDQNAIEILWRLGESHALGPLSALSSNTIELEMTDNIVRLTITSFAQSPDDAKLKVQSLNTLLKLVGFMQKNKNPVVYELLQSLKLSYNNKRVDANLTIPRSRATMMMHDQFAKTAQPQ